MKKILILLFVFLLQTDKKLRAQDCVDECFIYSKDSSEIIFNFYLIAEDSQHFYFGWDNGIYEDTGNLLTNYVFSNYKVCIAIPVDYEYQACEIATVLQYYLQNGKTAQFALAQIIKAFSESRGEDEFPWTTTLKMNLWLNDTPTGNVIANKKPR